MAKILIVEDETPLRQALYDKLKREGFNPLQAKNGEEGLDMALTERPDLILIDIIMPVMDGMTALKYLRNDEWGKKVPVIVLTNLSDANNVSTALENGAYDFLVKSDWSLADLITLIKKKLGIS